MKQKIFWLAFFWWGSRFIFSKHCFYSHYWLLNLKTSYTLLWKIDENLFFSLRIYLIYLTDFSPWIDLVLLNSNSFFHWFSSFKPLLLGFRFMAYCSKGIFIYYSHTVRFSARKVGFEKRNFFLKLDKACLVDILPSFFVIFISKKW